MYLFSVHPVLVSIHHLRHAPGLRTHPQQRDRQGHRHLHPEPRSAQLRRQPRDLLHVLRQLQQVSQVGGFLGQNS